MSESRSGVHSRPEASMDLEPTPSLRGEQGLDGCGQCRPRQGSCGSRRVPAGPLTWDLADKSQAISTGPWASLEVTQRRGGSLAPRYPMWLVLCAGSSSVPMSQAVSLFRR